jgi:hypothetical protein
MRLFACLHGVKKTFSMISYFRPHWSKNMVLVKIKSQNNIVSFRVQRSKKHFLSFFAFVPIGRKTWCRSGSKVKTTLFPSRFKGQKNIFYHFSLSCPLVEKHGVGQGQKSKRHCFLPAEYRNNMDGSS